MFYVHFNKDDCEEVDVNIIIINLFMTEFNLGNKLYESYVFAVYLVIFCTYSTLK